MMLPPLSNIVITTLVSLGQHPLSKRHRRADQDARALALMLSAMPSQGNALHVGNSYARCTQDVMRDYLGMGLSAIEVLDTKENADISHAITHYYTQSHIPLPDIFLTGIQSEIGESSGLLPYLLAERLNIPLVPNICALICINEKERYAEVMQSLPRGQRRKIRTTLPFIASVGVTAPAPRQSAFAVAKRGVIVTTSIAECPEDEQTQHWKVEPAKPRPKRIKMVKAKTAAQRFKAATAKVQGNKGETIYDADKAVTAILALLKNEKVM